jgi:hypothetical protein
MKKQLKVPINIECRVQQVEPYILYIKVPLLPKLYNSLERQSFWARRKERDEWHNLMRLVVGNNKPRAPLMEAHISAIRHSCRAPDPDALAMSFKFPIDALQELGVINNDNIQTIGYPEYRWKQCKRGAGL